MPTFATLPVLMLNETLLDTGKEWEIIPKGDLSLTVDIIYRDPSLAPSQETLITEVHWRFDSEAKGLPAQVAVESDIRTTGRTLDISRIAFMRVFGLSFDVNPSHS